MRRAAARGTTPIRFLWRNLPPQRILAPHHSFVPRLLFALATTVLACSKAPPQRYELGKPATATEIAARDIDVGPDGVGLPAGKGTVADGAALYAQKCAACHGVRGEGLPGYPALIGRDTAAENFVFGKRGGLTRTIGNYWPHATTVFDYVRRAMPHNAPGSLSNDEVYSLTAFLLAMNDVIAKDVVLDSATLRAVKMPYADRFVRDDRRGNTVR